MRKASNIMCTILTVVTCIAYLIFGLVYIPLFSTEIWFVPTFCFAYIVLLIIAVIIRYNLMERNHLAIGAAITAIVFLPAAIIPGIVCAVFTAIAEPVQVSNDIISLNELYLEKERYENILKNNPSAWAKSQLQLANENIEHRKNEIFKCLEEIEEDYEKEKLSESEYNFYKESYLKELDAEKQYLKELNSNL
ncbi:MAG: hypothetical protein K6B64_03255 [Acholeplasmatales bacterium]|nr:hypothetical protein [Acholeplasmatales bacterium]